MESIIRTKTSRGAMWVFWCGWVPTASSVATLSTSTFEFVLKVFSTSTLRGVIQKYLVRVLNTL